MMATAQAYVTVPSHKPTLPLTLCKEQSLEKATYLLLNLYKNKTNCYYHLHWYLLDSSETLLGSCLADIHTHILMLQSDQCSPPQRALRLGSWGNAGGPGRPSPVSSCWSWRTSSNSTSIFPDPSALKWPRPSCSQRHR